MKITGIKPRYFLFCGQALKRYEVPAAPVAETKHRVSRYSRVFPLFEKGLFHCFS